MAEHANLQRGDSGSRVRALQTALNNILRAQPNTLGGRYSPLVVDGSFGSLTEAAVRAVQERVQGITPSGIVYAGTQAVLGLQLVAPSGTTAPPIPASNYNPPPSTTGAQSAGGNAGIIAGNQIGSALQRARDTGDTSLYNSIAAASAAVIAAPLILASPLGPLGLGLAPIAGLTGYFTNQAGVVFKEELDSAGGRIYKKTGDILWDYVKPFIYGGLIVVGLVALGLFIYLSDD